MERDSRKLIKRLEDEGWTCERIKGSHHHFTHPNFTIIITVPHPKKDLPTGLVMTIHKLAGWR